MQPTSGDARPPTQHGTGVRGTRLGRMGGVEVILDRSWYMIAVLTVVLYGPVLWRLYPEAGWLNVLLAAVFALGLAGSVLAHELAHALVGRWMGWPVGRIVLTLMGGHTNFGVVRATAGSSAWVSLAGPVTNVVLALVGTGLLLGAPARDAGPGWALLELLVLANWVLGIFNLLPGLPLDGGRVVESVIWRVSGSESQGTAVAAWCGRVIAVLVVLWAFWRQLWLSPVALVVVVMGAVFIFKGASQALRQSRVLGAVRPLTAATLERPALEFAPDTHLSLVDTTVLAGLGHEHRARVPDVVARDPRTGRVGVLNARSAAAITQEARHHTAVGDVMDWCPGEAVTAPGVPGDEVLRRLEVNGFPWLLVLDESNTPTGVVHHGDIARHVLRQ